ncbi:MAG: sulfurtransferase [Syntrophobacterales bacterium]|jgi:thiosulfate/3-mercaptopyruvate sulfurtransferase|nr:sulfurtransferase [Syntrophobacterales bacterium]
MRYIQALNNLWKIGAGMMILTASCLAFPHQGDAFGSDLGLIDADTLNQNRARWVVLDARPKAEWEEGHIPRALPFCWEDYTRTDGEGIEYRMFSPRELADGLAGLGIDETTPVVVYGDANTSWGGEGWDAWVLSYLGHKGQIRILNGGIQAWLGKGLPLVKDTRVDVMKKKRYLADLNPLLDISSHELDRSRGSLAIIDVRSTFERLKGRIPGSVHIPWERFFEENDRRPISPAGLRKLLADHGVDTTRPIVYHCQVGVRSSYAWLVHELSGLPSARNYEGGMAAWQKQISR